jgi:hypothetical protein
MPKPTNYPKPDLSHLSNRRINLSGSRQSVEMLLFDWMSDIVKQTRQTREKGGFAPETLLMDGAQESINVLMQAAPMAAGMKLGPDNGKKLVHANVHWVRKPDGRWVLDQVVFALVASAAVTREATRRAEAEALRDAAERRSSMHINVRKVAFPVENYPLHDFPMNLKMGDHLIEYAIELAVENAREDAKALENPVTPVDMALDMATLGVGGLAKAGGEGAKHLKEVYEYIDKTKTVIDSSKIVTDKEKSTGDKALELGLGLSGSIPVAGPFIKTLAGMFLEGVIASDAARITKLRSRCYIFFVAGFVKQLALAETGRPVRKLDQKYFDLGMHQAPKSDMGRVKCQISLLHYASEHYTDGGWGGLGYRKEEWDFPDRYIVKWSPDLLGRSLATQLHTRRYLYMNA